jgi:hypothetical protein
MNWKTDMHRHFVRFAEEKISWDRSADELGHPKYVVNNLTGWRTVATIPDNQVWSYVFEQNYYQRDPKGQAGFLSFGINRAAEYFLVFDEPWSGGVSDVILSFRKTCRDCSSPHRWTSPDSPEPCSSCDGEHEIIYPGMSRQRGTSDWRLPTNLRSASTVYSKDVLLDLGTPSDLLITLAQRGNVNDRTLVAWHPSCSVEFLNDVLARDSQEEVRMGVARRAHKGLRPNLIRALCEDESENVRSIMASHNPVVVGEEVFGEFAYDRSVKVRTGLAQNSLVTDEAVRVLLRGAESEECKPIREALAHHPAIDANAELLFLTRNFEDLFSLMFYELLSRPDLTDSTLAALKAHTEPDGHLSGWVDKYGTTPIARRIIPSDLGGEYDEYPDRYFRDLTPNIGAWGSNQRRIQGV